jgi:hypothetical protein
MKEFYVSQKPFTFQDKFWRIGQDFFDSWNGDIKENETFFNSEYMDSGLDILISVEGNKIPFQEKYKNISKQMNLSYWDILPKFEKDNIINSYRNVVSSEYSKEFLEFYTRTQRVFKTFSSFRMPTEIDDRTKVSEAFITSNDKKAKVIGIYTVYNNKGHAIGLSAVIEGINTKDRRSIRVYPKLPVVEEIWYLTVNQEGYIIFDKIDR